MLKWYFFLLLCLSLLGFSSRIVAQEYTLVWEDNFDGPTLDPEKWSVENHIGIWNTGGNRELQHYRKENVSVGDDGQGNSCLIITAREEGYKGYDFTSGKVSSKGKFAFRRGKLEASIKMPDLANGLWPAFWTLGYTPIGWPDCGEIDILEMGQAPGLAQNAANSYIGAHLHWGPFPRDYGTSKVVPYDLSSAFFKYSVVWTEELISIYFHEDENPYFIMGITGDDTEEYRDFQHYIILNLAVGGALPQIFSKNEVTAPMPAKMYVDWVKVYQLEDSEDFKSSDLPVYGHFGVFEETAPVDMRMDLGFDLHENVIGASVRGGETAKEGDRVLSYNIDAGNGFDIRLTSVLNRNMGNYSSGSVQFYLKTEAGADLHIGVSDSTGNEAFYIWGSGADNDFERDGSWQMVYVPLKEMSEQGVDLSALSDMLIVKGDFDAGAYLSIDEVVYSETVPLAGIYGIYTNNPLISDKFTIDNVTGHLYNWSNTVSFNDAIPAYEGEDVLSFSSPGTAGWWGFGIFSSSPLNLERYSEGFLNLALRTNSSQSFSINIQGANETQGTVTFAANSGKYGFERDGKWHKISIPMSDFLAGGLNLSACNNIFTMSGSLIGNIGVDDIYLSETSAELENPALCYAVSLSISPKSTSIKTGASRKFTVSASNQFGNPADAFVNWSASGGSIDENGVFSANEPGTYIVTATLDDLSDEATVNVDGTSDATEISNKIGIAYRQSDKKLMIQSAESLGSILVSSVSGAVVYNEMLIPGLSEFDMGVFPPSVYIVRVQSGKEMLVRKFVNK